MRRRVVSRWLVIGWLGFAGLALAPAAVVALDPGAVATVAIDGGAVATASTSVDLALTTTDPDVSAIRISLDGSTWGQRAYAPSIAIELDDLTLGGGYAADGAYLVRVAFGDGNEFGEPVTDSILLDRVAPSWQLGEQANAGFALTLGGVRHDGLSGVVDWRHSFDGGSHWSPWATVETVDLREGAAGGSWATGSRTVTVQARDAAGNTSTPSTDGVTVDDHPDYTLGMHFDRSAEATTGSAYTVTPVYDLGVTPPATARCWWRLSWGNDGALFERDWDETFGNVQFERSGAKGGCGTWTFTLPYGPALQYMVEFAMCVPDGSSCLGAAAAEVVFDAAFGTDDRRIRQSNLPVAYLLPDKLITAVGEPITYRLLGSAGYDPPTGGEFTTACRCRVGPYPSKRGGTVFTFTPDTVGDWRVSWDLHGTFPRGAMFDPPARRPDTARPTTTAPRERIGGTHPDHRVPVTLTWSGSDRGWGIDHYTLWRSVDGGSWRRVTLARPRSTSARVWQEAGHQYQYRVRAVDRAGNAGALDVGPRLRTRVLSDDVAAIDYGLGWTVRAAADARGGSLHEATTEGATARMTVTARDLAILAETGPAHGRMRVYVDGSLARTVDLAAAQVQGRHIVFERHWPAPGAHTIRIVAEGTAGRPLVTLDDVLLLR